MQFRRIANFSKEENPLLRKFFGLLRKKALSCTIVHYGPFLLVLGPSLLIRPLYIQRLWITVWNSCETLWKTPPTYPQPRSYNHPTEVRKEAKTNNPTPRSVLCVREGSGCAVSQNACVSKSFFSVRTEICNHRKQPVGATAKMLKSF